MKPAALKAAVLISGTGSNLKALIDAVAAKTLDLDIVQVISNRKEAAGIGHARRAGIPVSVIEHTDYPVRAQHDAAVADVLLKSRAELIVLAGYMRILGEDFTRRFEGRMINLHPSLLPLYMGLDTYNRALAAGDAETGSSMHFVTAGLDSGPVISQVRMPVLPGDDEASLKARLGPLEHRLVVATAGLFCRREIAQKDDSVVYRGRVLLRPLQLQEDGSFT
jgi:phosphoribosylglycinamide formyltransferase-1